MLDDFTTGPFGPLTTTNAAGPVGATQSSLPTSNVIGGERVASASEFWGGGSVSLELDLSGPINHGATFTVNPGGVGQAIFIYGANQTLGGIDLTQGGQIDSLTINLTQDPGNPIGNEAVQGNGIGIWFDPLTFRSAGATLNGNGEYEFLFSGMTLSGGPGGSHIVDLTSVDQIQIVLTLGTVNIVTGTNTGPVTASIGSVSVVPSIVPEPATLTVLAVALLGVTTRRRMA